MNYRAFEKEKFDIIIQGGQSNSAGTGYGDTDEPYEPNDKIWYLNGDFTTGEFTIAMAAEDVVENVPLNNFSLTFAKEYIKNGLLSEGRKLLIIRAASGGTGFADHRWGMTDDLYLRMMKMIRETLALNEENRLVGFLWHQGETDALANASYELHYDHLMQLLCSVRKEFNVPQLPFVAGDFVQLWKEENPEVSIPVADAIRAVCKDCSNGAFVETDGLLSNLEEHGQDPFGWGRDSIHFSRKAQNALGRRYFEAFCKL